MSQQPRRSRKLLHHLLALDISFGPPEVEAIPVCCGPLPTAFRLSRIAVVADVHLPDQLVNIDRLIRCVAAQHPDAVFLVGDLTNSYTDFDEAGLRHLAAGLAAVAPCFAVPGNHEWRLGREPRYRAILAACGVAYLCDSYADWVKDGERLRLFGMGKRRPFPLEVADQPSIVLAHRPEYLSYYADARWDVVVCGHAHGGHVRMGERSLYAPDQGFFPTYTAGVYTQGDTTMVVSRGLGNSSIPWRIGNRPHLPVLVLVPRLENSVGLPGNTMSETEAVATAERRDGDL